MGNIRPPGPDAPTVALVHDYLTQRGGAERVVLTLAKAFPGAPLYTTLFEPDLTFPAFEDVDVVTSVLQRIGPLRRHHRLALPLYAPVVSSMKVPAAVAVCSTSGWAHGVRAQGAKVVYVHNTARWLYQPEDYYRTAGLALRTLGRLIRPVLRRWDQRAIADAAVLVANSFSVQDRIRRIWGRDALVVHPPHSVDPGGARRPVAGLEPGFFLAVARLISYKRLDVLIEAVAALPGRRLVIVGEGPDEARLRRLAAGSATVLLGAVEEDELRWLYANCTALVSAASEDLGLAPVEAMAFGRPVVVLRKGGFLETVAEGVTGVYFDEPVAPEVVAALELAEQTSWDPDDIRRHAETFSEESFIARMRAIVRDVAPDAHTGAPSAR
jgi:glycosyltransferase involved in cell wall biosynthesis